MTKGIIPKKKAASSRTLSKGETGGRSNMKSKSFRAVFCGPSFQHYKGKGGGGLTERSQNRKGRGVMGWWGKYGVMAQGW